MGAILCGECIHLNQTSVAVTYVGYNSLIQKIIVSQSIDTKYLHSMIKLLGWLCYCRPLIFLTNNYRKLTELQSTSLYTY